MKLSRLPRRSLHSLLAMTRRGIFWLLLLFSLFYLFTLPHYGLTWDEPLHLKSGLIDIKNWQGQNIPWMPETLSYGPLAETLGALSFLLFSSTLHLLPFDVAFHLPIVLFGIWGIYVVYLFGRDFFNEKVGLWSAFFLAILPRYVGHLHNNIKDIPSAVLFATAVYFFTKLWFTPQGCKCKNFLAATFITGLALNQKINAIEIFPIVFGSALLTSFEQKKKLISLKIKPLLGILLAFFLSLFITFILWPRLWSNPVQQIDTVLWHFSSAWRGNSVAYFGRYYLAGIDLPWTYALAMIGITTPIYILGFGVIGVLKTIWGILLFCHSRVGGNLYKIDPRVKPEDDRFHFFLYILLLLWFFLPTLKYLIPSLVVYDDIRQYMEVIFPLVLFAGIGADWFINSLRFAVYSLRFDKIAAIVLAIIFIGHFVYVEKNYFPYETSYFNVLVGGLKGADKQIFDPDFWANPEKEALLWLNKNAPLNSTVDILLAREVADYYLRSDFKRLVNNDDIFIADYVVILNRPSLFWLNNNLRNTYKFMYSHKPVYTIQRDNTPLLFIYSK